MYKRQALLIVSLNPGLAGAVWLFVIPTVFVLFSTVAGLFFDLKYPNYDWTSEYQAVKQSPGVLITMAAGLVCAVLPMVLLYAAANYAQLILAADAVLMLLLTGVMYGCLRRVRPVSYTHLDVYKRQRQRLWGYESSA